MPTSKVITELGRDLSCFLLSRYLMRYVNYFANPSEDCTTVIDNEWFITWALLLRQVTEHNKALCENMMFGPLENNKNIWVSLLNWLQHESKRSKSYYCNWQVATQIGNCRFVFITLDY